MDAFNGKRNATAFQTNPYGALNDLQVFDDYVKDQDWDALWRSRSFISDSGWTCEMAIPWKTLRYPKATVNDSTVWGLNLIRISRRDNETSAFPGYPRSFDTYRMAYAALLKGIEPPSPGSNIQVNPYWINQLNKQSVTIDKKPNDYVTKLGGEIKWSPTVHSSLDFTVNTDFAQADADRQVNNLTRFSVLFPERRQFFLENAGLFNAGSQYIYQPFFSRRIGLDNAGNPIPIDAGIRYTDKNTKYSFGAIYVHQRSTEFTQAANNSVLSFIKNYGKQNNLSVLITNKIEEANDTLKANINSTVTLSGFNQLSNKMQFNFSVSGSQTSGNYKDNGFATNTRLRYSSNNFSWIWLTGIISKNYNPQLGFRTRNDFIKNYADIYLIKRKQKWLPGFIRSFEPGFLFDVYNNINDFKLQEAFIDFYPLFFVFNNGSKFIFNCQFNQQNLTSNFNPLGIDITAGRYSYFNINANFSSDQSRKFSWTAGITAGGYYNGTNNSFTGGVRYAASPHLAANLSYETNMLRNVGSKNENLTTQLLTPNLRMALNPRVQLNVFYQYNTATESSRWNARFSWEYRPLSYIYLVWNENKTNGLMQDQSIGKISYLKQF